MERIEEHPPAVVALFEKFDAEEEPVDPQALVHHERTYTFYYNLSRLLTCKKTLDELYTIWVQSTNKILNRDEFRSMGPSSRLEQERPHNKSVEEIRKGAQDNKPAFDALLRDIVVRMGLNPDEVVRVKGKSIVKDGNTFRVLTTVPLKAKDRCFTKVRNEYGGIVKYLCDVGRATIVCYTEHQIAEVLLALRKHADVVRLKNRFANPIYTGVRDLLVNMRVNGHIFELQIHQADMLAENTRSNAHAYYEHFREYFVGSRETYKERMEMFDKLGDEVRTAENVEDGIRSILEGSDETKIGYLADMSSSAIFNDLKLELMAKKRLWEISKNQHAKRRLGIMGLIQNVYARKANYTRSMEIGLAVLKGLALVLNDEHPDILDAMQAVAQANYRESQKLLEEILRRQKQILRIEQQADNISMTYTPSPNTCSRRQKCALQTMCMYAMVHDRQQNSELALEFYNEALRGRRLLLGMTHPDVLWTMAAIANIHHNHGDYNIAMDGYQELLRICESTLGVDHPHSLQAKHSVACTHFEQGNRDAALKIHQDVVPRMEWVLGPDHPFTLSAMEQYATCTFEVGRHQDASELFARVLDGRRRALGEDHPDTVKTRQHLAFVENLLSDPISRVAYDIQQAQHRVLFGSTKQ